MFSLYLRRKTNPVIHFDCAVLASRQRHFDHNIDIVVAIGNRTEQHWQTDASDDFDVTGVAKLKRAIARRATHYVGNDQYAGAVIDACDRRLRKAPDLARVLVGPDIDCFKPFRPSPKHMRGRLDEGIAEWSVCQEQYTYHVI
jgi:hypothetical protein